MIPKILHKGEYYRMPRAYHKLPKGATNKQCVACGQTLPLERFYKSGNSYWPKCKECARVERRERYIANHDKQNQQSKERYAAIMDGRKGACVICGESRPACIDFHHIDPATKSFTIGGHIAGHTEDEIDAEMAKCVCICSNCHRDFHHQYGNNPKQPKAAWDEYYKLHKRDTA